jgi:hypothetical protein
MEQRKKNQTKLMLLKVVKLAVKRFPYLILDTVVAGYIVLSVVVG